MHIGMNKMSFSRHAGSVIKGVTVALIRVSIVALQNRHRVTEGSIFHFHHTGNPRRVVRCVRLKRTAAQRLLKRKAFFQSFVNRIRLIPVGHDRLMVEHPHRSIDNQARILQLRRIKRLGTNPFPILHKNAVAAVFAAPHYKISGHSLRPVGRSPDDNSSSRIRIVLQFLFQ